MCNCDSDDHSIVSTWDDDSLVTIILYIYIIDFHCVSIVQVNIAEYTCNAL